MPITKQALDHLVDLKLRPQRFEVLDRLIQGYIEQDQMQALVVKALRYGVPIYEIAAGTNTRAGGVRMDTIFPVASNTKSIISALLLILQEDGLVDLNHPVYYYLPEFYGGGRENICLWHFLTHSSGLKDEEIQPGIRAYIQNELGLTPPADEASDEEWTAFDKAVHEKLGLAFGAESRDRLQNPNYLISLRLPVNHGPRSHMTYCNYGYQRLKDIIDAVTGEPIDQFAQRVLFHPLGMYDTYWRVPREKWGRILGRNEKCAGYPWINSESNHLSESGSGGLKTTPNDITRFCQMILNGGELDGVRVLSKASVREMTTNHNDGMSQQGNTDWSAWGLGWNIRRDKMDDSGCLRSPGCLDHGGWAGHKIFADPETGLVFAMYGGEYNPRDTRPGSRPFTWLGEVSNVLYSALD